MNEKKYTLKDKIMAMGPGLLIVGSFIGPGTVTSSTRAGANYGYDLLWCVVFSVVAVIIMQGMSARLGIVTQKGIPENLLKELKDRPFLKNFMVFPGKAAVLSAVFPPVQKAPNPSVPHPSVTQVSCLNLIWTAMII